MQQESKPMAYTACARGTRAVLLGHLALNAWGAMLQTSDCAASLVINAVLSWKLNVLHTFSLFLCFLDTGLTRAFSFVTGSHWLPFLMHSSLLKWILAICDSLCGTGETLPASSSVYRKIVVSKVSRRFESLGMSVQAAAMGQEKSVQDWVILSICRANLYQRHFCCSLCC